MPASLKGTSVAGTAAMLTGLLATGVDPLTATVTLGTAVREAIDCHYGPTRVSFVKCFGPGVFMGFGPS